MDEQVVRMAIQEVMEELGMSERRYELETATAAANSDAIEIRVYDHSGDNKSVTVDLRDKEGQPVIYLDEIKDRVRRQLETFARIRNQ